MHIYADLNTGYNVFLQRAITKVKQFMTILNTSNRGMQSMAQQRFSQTGSAKRLGHIPPARQRERGLVVLVVLNVLVVVMMHRNRDM
jgi:hypothetical protein